MKHNENPAPRGNWKKGKLKAVMTAVILFAAAVYTGYSTSPEDVRLPVMLADGQVIIQPCYVAVDGECVALVKNEKTAERVVEEVEQKYTNEDTTECEIQETTTIQQAKLKNGDEKPKILTAEEACEYIVESEALTVKTKEVIQVEETVEYKTIEKESGELNLGRQEIAQQGRNGLSKVTKEIIKENGETIEETVISQEVITESVPEIIISGTSGLAEPLENMTLTSPYGARWGRMHKGIDLGVPEGTPVHAAKSGTVTYADYNGSFGNLVIIDHGEGMETYYAHCSSINVCVGQAVETGDTVAAAGSTGNSTGPHLHFEVRVDGVPEDPQEWLPQAEL